MQAPYPSKGQRDVRNAIDRVYVQGGGKTLLNVTQNGSIYTATFAIGLAS